MINKKYFSVFIAGIFSAFAVQAHEAYVLPRSTFWGILNNPDPVNLFADVLKNPADLHVAFYVILGVAVLLLANFFFRRSKAGKKVSNEFEKFSSIGPLFIRAAVAVSLFLSATSMSFLGPELQLQNMPVAHILQIGLYAASIMIAFGIFTEVGAIISLVVFSAGAISYGLYMITYLNYFAEFVVLLLFGMRTFSVDKYIFGPARRFKFFRKYETTIVRVGYGIALIFAAVTVKLLHPSLTLDVINDYNLTQFHWLFPSDPELIVLGAFLVETAMGFFIMIGFELRLTVLISLFYLTLSVIFFKEMVWPHLILYGISFNLLLQPEVFTLDHLLLKKHRRKKSWWKRPFSPHVKELRR